ncbi:MAG: polysaccharide deacetylase family protein [Pseudomonadota bacterium]
MTKHLQSVTLLALLLISYAVPLHADVTPAPIRFLITFDDGPSGSNKRNPTELILDVLAQNTVQPGIKAIFFVETRATTRGATEIGQLLMHRQQAEGHLLAFHTSTPSHSNHRLMAPEHLELSLEDGINDLRAVSGIAPQLVRPPFWNYDARTLASYNRHGLQMLLTDLSANDGVIWGMNWNWRKRDDLLQHLRATKAQWTRGKMPSIDGITPIVVTFHDINRRTARHLEAYLKMLLNIAQELDMPVAAKPFYDNRAELENAALVRSVRHVNEMPALPGIWNWMWR